MRLLLINLVFVQSLGTGMWIHALQDIVLLREKKSQIISGVRCEPTVRIFAAHYLSTSTLLWCSGERIIRAAMKTEQPCKSARSSI